MQVTFHLMIAIIVNSQKVYVAFSLLTYNICSGSWPLIESWKQRMNPIG